MAAKKKATAKKKQVARKAVPKKPIHPLKINLQSWNKDKVFDYLCEKISTTSFGLRRISEFASQELGEFPTVKTIMEWMNDSKELCERYARAKELQADYMVDESIDIADDATNDWMDKIGKDGEVVGYQINGEHVQRSRLRIETRKWHAAKLNPKKYGDKVEIGGNKENPIHIEVTAPEIANAMAMIAKKL